MFFQRKNAVLVFQQHHALRGDEAGQPMVLVRIERDIDLLGIGGLEHDVQYPLDCPVQQFFRQKAAFDRFHDFFVPVSAVTRHFQVEAGGQAGHAVVDRAPVRHDESFESPFLPQDVGQQGFVFRGVRAVDFVVGRHHSPRLGLPDRPFESRQVDFALRPLIDDGVDVHPPVFLIVHCIMLGRRSDALALHAANVAGGHFCGQIRILGKIFEISAAKSATV